MFTAYFNAHHEMKTCNEALTALLMGASSGLPSALLFVASFPITFNFVPQQACRIRVTDLREWSDE